MIKGREKSRTKHPCRCGGTAVFRVGTVEHMIFDKPIALHNVPHFKCDFCGTVMFDSNTDVVSILRIAFQEGLDEIDWNT